MTTLFISHSSKDKAWAERMHQALARGGYRCLFLDSHPDDGIHAGAEWEQTLYQRLRESRGVVALLFGQLARLTLVRRRSDDVP